MAIADVDAIFKTKQNDGDPLGIPRPQSENHRAVVYCDYSLISIITEVGAFIKVRIALN